jgi:hypothetical protein
VIPSELTQNLGGSWSALTAAGEATNLNIVHLNNIDCTDVDDLTKVCRGHYCIIPDDDFSPYMCAASFAHAWVSAPT